MMRRVLVLAVLASSAAAFHAPAAGFLRQRLRTAASPRLRQAPVSPVRLAAAGGDDPEVVFDANAGWQADHNKAAAAMASGGHQQLKIKDQGTNQDTPDFFETEDGGVVGSSNALDANINTRSQIQEDLEKKAASKDSGNANVLQELLSSDNAMVKEFDRQTYTKTLERIGGFVAHKWKVDGDWTTEPETFGLTFNTVAQTKSQLFLQPNAMTFEDFLAGWTDDTAEGFQVTPTKGTMDRRGGEETPFTVTYTGPQPTEPVYGTLVVLLPNDNFQWTFKFQVSPP